MNVGQNIRGSERRKASLADYGLLLVLLGGNDFLFFGLASNTWGLAATGALFIAFVVIAARWVRTTRAEMALFASFMFGAHAFAVPLLTGGTTGAWLFTLISGAVLTAASLFMLFNIGAARQRL